MARATLGFSVRISDLKGMVAPPESTVREGAGVGAAAGSCGREGTARPASPILPPAPAPARASAALRPPAAAPTAPLPPPVQAGEPLSSRAGGLRGTAIEEPGLADRAGEDGQDEARTECGAPR
ncbi:hypothetical protein caldi_08370 [Caldinitratiruptor microaerophilus]|uniref:Uncharacterized protein n=1 Tax=Caldinitratiruptor microaerophilus TaxID=671077 RepID=A0AA35CIK6_9FIRM|nr:hypothetical protein caldi_08370 [Caldinitratiruptor microaerophilus]